MSNKKINLPSKRKKNPSDNYYRAKELRAAGQSLDELMDCENGYSMERVREMFGMSKKPRRKRMKFNVSPLKYEQHVITHDGKEIVAHFDVVKFEYPCRRKKPFFMFYIQTKWDETFCHEGSRDTITSEAQISWVEYNDKQKLRAFLENWLQYEDIA